jgi:predicted protein tyrosine phosphatase
MDLMNRLGNCHNQYQGNFKKVLCVCSAGLLRSPSTAFVLSQEPFNFNTRAAGIVDSFALIVVDQVLLEWADEIVCMDASQTNIIKRNLENYGINNKPVHNLKIPDNFEYRNPELLKIIKEKCYELYFPVKE